VTHVGTVRENKLEAEEAMNGEHKQWGANCYIENWKVRKKIKRNMWWTSAKISEGPRWVRKGIILQQNYIILYYIAL